LRLHTKLMAGICILIFVIVGIFEYTFRDMIEANLKHEKGTKALAVAEAISYMPDIKEAFYTKEPSKIIQPIVEKIRRQVDAEFIVDT